MSRRDGENRNVHDGTAAQGRLIIEVEIPGFNVEGIREYAEQQKIDGLSFENVVEEELACAMSASDDVLVVFAYEDEVERTMKSMEGRIVGRRLS